MVNPADASDVFGVPLFAFFLSIWTTVFVELWKRKQNFLDAYWGCDPSTSVASSLMSSVSAWSSENPNETGGDEPAGVAAGEFSLFLRSHFNREKRIQQGKRKGHFGGVPVTVSVGPDGGLSASAVASVAAAMNNATQLPMNYPPEDRRVPYVLSCAATTTCLGIVVLAVLAVLVMNINKSSHVRDGRGGRHHYGRVCLDHGAMYAQRLLKTIILWMPPIL